MIRLFLHTRWRAQSHQWDAVNGLVEYSGENITPREVYERFPNDYPMFDVLRCEVCERIDVEGEIRPYRWITMDRLG